MNHVSKSIFVTLILALALNSTFCQKSIELSIDPSNDTLLVLSDGGETSLGNVFNRKVSWKIADPKILSFQIVPKHGTDHPFEDNPTRSHGNRVDARVRFLGTTGVWYYSIIWRDATREYRPDPKIAVKPFISPLTESIILLGFVVTAITSIVFFRKWRNAAPRPSYRNPINT